MVTSSYMRRVFGLMQLSAFGACATLAGKPAPALPADAYEDSAVDVVAVRIPTMSQAGPVYPPKLRNERVQGQAIVLFVIDTLGRPDMSTFKVISTDHPLFADAAKTAVRNTRFTPAEKGGHKVKMIARQPFTFTLVP